MSQKFKIEGLKEVEAALADLPNAVGKSALRKAAGNALEPIARDARGRAPRDQGDLQENIVVSSRLTRSQSMAAAREGKSSVEMYAGATSLPYAHMVEFGTSDTDPQPFLRPAWDANKGKLLSTIGPELWVEIERAVNRHARKTARMAKG